MKIPYRVHRRMTQNPENQSNREKNLRKVIEFAIIRPRALRAVWKYSKEKGKGKFRAKVIDYERVILRTWKSRVKLNWFSPIDFLFFFTFSDTESSQGNPSETSPIQNKWRSKSCQNENAFHASFSCDSPDSCSDSRKEKDNTLQNVDTEMEDSSMSVSTLHKENISQSKIRRDILKHVNRMCNPVWIKASEQALLQ